MKIDLKLQSDTYNSYCEELIIGFEIQGDREFVWIELGDREVAVNREEFKKLLSIV